ncbi:MAG: type II toxin-antitoxin system death-on-curing family toxin [Bacteriovoracaceae bacterium]|nr:type II toxin-antitoxin system death-on-curing family toxin [Bacteriovoracaceae bacterium]
MKIQRIKKSHVLLIHNKLVEDSRKSLDTEPIPPTIRSMNLLESGIYVQNTSYDGIDKYKDCLHCAAALTYSLVTNHPFENGNKRTALVTLLSHLDMNEYTFNGKVTEDHLFCFFVSCAAHRLNDFISCKSLDSIKNLKKTIQIEQNFLQSDKFKVGDKNMDQEVNLIKIWLNKNTRKYDNSDQKISVTELVKILKRFKIKSVYYPERQILSISKGLFATSTKISLRTSHNGKKVPKKEIAKLRKKLDLTESKGIDSKSFYHQADCVYDHFILEHRVVLRELAGY